MTNYWVIAPVESKPADVFDKVWSFDLANGCISIGWRELGDVSRSTREELLQRVQRTYPDKPATTHSLIRNMIWSFYHEIKPGDIIIARRGRKILAGTGTVKNVARYEPDKCPDSNHADFLDVEWNETPRDLTFRSVVFPMPTLGKRDEEDYKSLLKGFEPPVQIKDEFDELVDEQEFIYEKHLEDYVVQNLDNVFHGQLRLYEDAEGYEGQQYETIAGIIDILAVERSTGSYVVIELKKGKSSDTVVGQILRYMGWVKKYRACLASPHHDFQAIFHVSRDSIVIEQARPWQITRWCVSEWLNF